MEIKVNYGDVSRTFKDANVILIGNSNADFVVPDLMDNEVFKLIYAEKYNNYVLINQAKNPELLCNGKVFSKILVASNFEISSKSLDKPIKFSVVADETTHTRNNEHADNVNSHAVTAQQQTKQEATVMQTTVEDDIFNGDTEKNRISIIKEIGYKTTELKQSIGLYSKLNLILTAAMVILSVVSSFGITNYLLGLKVDSSAQTINLTTNFWFLAGISLIVTAICVTLKYAVGSFANVNSAVCMYGKNNVAQKFIVAFCTGFLFISYVLNLCYYKPILGFSAVFVSLLFVGGLATVSIGSGHFFGQVKVLRQHLDAYEYREDFEAIIKNYRVLISKYINKLSTNKINTVKSHLLNHQFRMIIEVMVGLLTSPFLAYGVSNTIASCFPEAANWIRISGIRFSPVFLILATFLIIFAFFSFVRAFTIGKQIKGSEIIKYDGFHDYNRHGVTILGLDSMKTLEREKKVVMFIACSIIFIEFTMNVSYFITEIGGDIQGMLSSIIIAFVPTALLIAETHMLSATMYKINNLNELLENLD